MDKNKAAEELKKKGYDASGSDGIVMVRYPAGSYESVEKAVKKILTDIGYNASWGLTLAKGVKIVADETEAPKQEASVSVLSNEGTEITGPSCDDALESA